MPYVPQEVKERLKREVSIQRLAEARGIKLRRVGKELIGLCPFHDDRNPSLNIDPVKNVWSCKGACGEGGDVIRWVARTEGVSDGHAIALLKRDYAPSSGPVVKQSTVPKLPCPVTLGAEDRAVLLEVVKFYGETLRETVEAKRFRAAVTGEPFYSEMGKGVIQTLYFGKRPNVIRIYDKLAEYKDQYRTLVRKLGKDVEPPSFESVFSNSNPDSTLTRVERQIGGRIPTEVGTLRQLTESGFDFRPFAKLKIIDHASIPEIDSNVSFETRCTGLYLRGIAQNDGMQAANAFISKHSNGNASWVRKKYHAFLASSSSVTGITEADLQQRFAESLALQMSA